MSTTPVTTTTESLPAAAAAIATSSEASATTGKRKLRDPVGEDSAQKGDAGDARGPGADGSDTAGNTIHVPIRIPSNIVPLRVDVRSADKTIRIVDTVLFDPTCWPVTLYKPLYESVEENVHQLAHTILSDAEVQVRIAVQCSALKCIDD